MVIEKNLGCGARVFQCSVILFFRDRRDRSPGGVQTSEADDPVLPVALECGVGDAFARRSVVEAVLVSNDAHVAQAVQEDQRTESKTLVAFDRRGSGPEASCTRTFEVHPCLAEDRPDEAGAIVAVRA